jgi:hypothetical protein
MSADVVKFPNTEFHENPSGRIRALPNSGADVQTDVTSSRFSQLLCERA